MLPNKHEDTIAQEKVKLKKISIRFLNLLRKEYNNVINDRVDDAEGVVRLRRNRTTERA